MKNSIAVVASHISIATKMTRTKVKREARGSTGQADNVNVIVVSHGFQEHYTIGFVNALARHGVNVLLVRSSFLDPNRLDKRVVSVDYGQNTGAQHAPGQKLSRFIQYNYRLFQLPFRNRDATIHVIGLLRHIVVMGIIEGLVFRLACRRYVLTVHNLLPHDDHSRLNALLYKLIYRIPHKLVVHTKRMKMELNLVFGVSEDKILIQEHGLNDAVPDHGKSKAECRENLGIDLNKFTLLFFGRIAPYKGLDILLKAFSELGDGFTLVIAGQPVSQAYGVDIESVIQKNQLGTNVRYIGDWIGDADVATYFHACDCLVMPYRHIDQSGLVFLAMRFGLPVISFDVGSIREYVGSLGGIVVTESTSAALQAAIKNFAATRRTFARELILSQCRRYSWENVTKPLIEYYRMP